jgi:hypothetical protein
MIKYIKEWYNDYQAAMKELNKSGVFICYHSHGAVCHYVEDKLTDHINTEHDKQRTISKDNRKIKV